MSPRLFHTLRGLCLLALTPLLPACGGYQLRGKVIEGPASAVMVVDENDKRLEAQGISGASVEAMLDPRYVNRKPLGRTIAGGDGAFALPIDETGAGFLEYEISLTGRARGYVTAYELLHIPGSNKRVLIMLKRGHDTYVPPEDPLEDSRRFLPPR